MWLSKLNEMSVGPLWVLRAQPGSVQPAEVCAHCRQNWLLETADHAAVLIVLDTALTEATQQALLHNCLKAAGWQDSGSILSLHGACSASPAPALQALQTQLAQAPGAAIIVFGQAAAQRINPQFQRGQVHHWQAARLIVTHDLQQMLEQPALKAEVWSDLCLARYGL